ncbi:putative uncharacterized transposon-derived protein F52C9.6 [Varanus komodoensis]|nr:putative uncharacterized transposon-derived protein F52C9.6 [Varanus komodoensis]
MAQGSGLREASGRAQIPRKRMDEERTRLVGRIRNGDGVEWCAIPILMYLEINFADLNEITSKYLQEPLNPSSLLTFAWVRTGTEKIVDLDGPIFVTPFLLSCPFLSLQTRVRNLPQSSPEQLEKRLQNVISVLTARDSSVKVPKQPLLKRKERTPNVSLIPQLTITTVTPFEEQLVSKKPCATFKDSLEASVQLEHIVRKTGLDKSPVGIKIARRNTKNLRYADDTTLMAESKEELKSLLMRVKEESAKVDLKLNIKKTKIMKCFIRTMTLRKLKCKTQCCHPMKLKDAKFRKRREKRNYFLAQHLEWSQYSLLKDNKTAPSHTDVFDSIQSYPTGYPLLAWKRSSIQI